MLNIGKLAGGGENYYLSQVASGVEDYYTGRGESVGYWTGAAAAGLGLSGDVQSKHLRAVLRGNHPHREGDDARLGSWKSGRLVPGFDLTFRAPKSVSVMWGLGDDETNTAVRRAHDNAVEAAIAYLEEHAGWSRRGVGGRDAVQGRGFVAAAFRHRTSRAGDPLLHTHVLVANMSQAQDDRKWRTIDARRIYSHAKTAGYLYQAQLRHELTSTLGVDWHPVTNGYADIKGVDSGVVREFSQRRQQIVRRMAERGESSAHAAQIATLDTRRPKQDAPDESLRDLWAARAAAFGFGDEDLVAAMDRRTYLPPSEEEVARACAAVVAPTGATHHSSTFTQRDVIQLLCTELDAAVDVAGVLRTATTALQQDPVVELDDAPESQRVVGLAEATYSTDELLRVEQHLITTAQRRRATGVGVAADAAIARATARRPSLRAEQNELVRRLCGDGDGVAVVVGKAGAGKTFALDAAREAWQNSGYRVIGCALAGQAARELADSTGIDCYSIKALLHQLEGPDARARLSSREILLVDEAGMVGTRHLARLSDLAASAGAKLVLIGDHRQLPEIHAGGAFGGLVERLDVIQLLDNQRQHEPWERAALDQLRDGEPEVAVGVYRRRGRLVLAETADDLRDTMVSDWWESWTNDGPAGGIMVALRVSDVEDLNARARERMVATAQVSGAAVETEDGLTFQAGDRAVIRRGRTFTAIGGGAARVENGQRGTITGVDTTIRAVTVQIDDGPVIKLPAGYIDGGHLQHGYAITGHRAQGLTTERCFVLGSDALYREWGYTAMSRGKTTNNMYIVAQDLSDLDEELDRHGIQLDERDPMVKLTHWISRSKGQQLAIDFTDDAEPDLAS